MIYLTRSNFLTGDVDQIGPFGYIQITYLTVRIPENNFKVKYFEDGSGNAIAKFGESTNPEEDGDLWKFADGTEWTDLIITDSYELGQNG